MEYDLYRYQDFQNQRDRNSPRYSYSQPQQQQSPMSNMQLQGLDSLIGNMGGGTTASSGVYAGMPEAAIQGGSAGGTGAGSGYATGGSSWASLGPWAALAAAIVGNETAATDAGRRREGSDYYNDLLTGRVLSQDTDYYTDKVFGGDNLGFGGDARAGAALLSFQPSKAWDELKGGTLLGLFS